MDIREFLPLLQGVKGPNSKGEYTARCPCHDDRQASLTVTVKPSPNDGRKRIYFFCHAKCTYEAIMDRLGLKPVDLIVNPDPPNGGGKAPAKARKPAAQPKPAAGKPKPSPGKPADTADDRGRIDWAHPDAVYSYTDADGKELFQVVRYPVWMKDGTRDKTFRQRHYDPRHPEANRDGYVNSVPDELRDNTLYRMPELAVAVRENRPVYVVEGEKDVETLMRLGFTATCNPGGAGKWLESYSRLLQGADVIILPDSDIEDNHYAGQNHALDVAVKTKPYAKRVRLVDVKAACPEIPDKGDISDMVELMGDQAAMDALARQVAATLDFDPAAVPFWLTPLQQAERLYCQVENLQVDKGRIMYYTKDAYKVLTDFVVLPRMQMVRDDGANSSMWFVLDGWNRTGKRLPRTTVSASELDAMSWVTRTWGLDAIMTPGNATKEKVAWAIKQVGQMSTRRVTEYTHTGWRKIDGKWVYLYHGGAIGMDGVTVRMEGPLSRYRLDGSGSKDFADITYLEGAEKSMALLTVMKEKVAVALLSTLYVAPLREFLEQAHILPSYTLYLVGRTQTGKTTAATLGLSHYGIFNEKLPKPASFHDTANSIRYGAFLLKDMPYLIDDYHPVGTPQEKRQMISLAQSLSRAFGDGAERRRMNADGTLKAPTPPRCVSIITGEDMPDVGSSGVARFYVCRIREGDVYMGETLTELQEDALKGYLQKAMRGYIKWLQAQTDGLPERLHEMFLNLRHMVNQRSEALKGRAPDTIACMMIGYQMMLRYFRDIGMFDNETGTELFYEAFRILVENSEEQTRDSENDKPTQMYLESLSELIASRAVTVKDTNPGKGEKGSPADNMIGYYDLEYYYLLPSKTHAAVSKLYHDQGREFPLSQRALYAYLEEEGIISKKGKDYTENKWIDGASRRVLRISRVSVDGDRSAARSEQIPMDLTEVDDPDNPFKG